LKPMDWIKRGGVVLENQAVVKKDFAVVSPNFSFMAEYDETLYKCAIQAERFIFEDPNTTLYKNLVMPLQHFLKSK